MADGNKNGVDHVAAVAEALRAMVDASIDNAVTKATAKMEVQIKELGDNFTNQIQQLKKELFTHLNIPLD